MIDKIDHYSLNHPATVYDEEALTAVKLAARTAAKVNECVAEVNTIPDKVESEFEQNLIDGTFDKAIDHYAGDIKTRVENILGGIPTNPTALDAEVVDIRLGENGITYGTAGAAVRAQVANTIKMRSDLGNELDLNNKLDLGCYYLSSYYEWKNTPQGMSNAGLLIVLSEAVQGRKTQIFINGQGVAYRSQYVTDKTDGSFSDWKVGASLADVYELHGIINEELPYKFMNFKEISNAGTVNLDNITDIGCYMFGSSHTLTNAPARIGMLIVYKGKNDYNVYQSWYGYDGKIYTRNFIYNEGFTPWVRMLTEDDITAINPAKYRFKVTGNGRDTVYITQLGERYDARFTFKKESSVGVEGDVVAIRGVHLIDKISGAEKTLCDSGVDIDGVVHIEAPDDDIEFNIGGVHGYEFNGMTAEFIINGHNYLMTDIGSSPIFTDFVLLQIDSSIRNPLQEVYDLELYRTWVFDENGLTITNNYYMGEEPFGMIDIRAGMFNVPNNILKAIYYNNATHPLLPTHANPSFRKIEDVSDVSDIVYNTPVGNSYVKFIGEDFIASMKSKAIICQDSLSIEYHDADVSGQTALKIKNYGNRIKAYYIVIPNNQNGHYESVYTENVIKIEC